MYVTSAVLNMHLNSKAENSVKTCNLLVTADTGDLFHPHSEASKKLSSTENFKNCHLKWILCLRILYWALALNFVWVIGFEFCIGH